MTLPATCRLIAEVGIVEAGRRLGVAAILYTYACTIACRHCCFACAPNRPRVHMTTGQAVEHLHALHALGRVIHIAGGECMMHWRDLQDVLREAHAAGVAPHFIETNCGVILGNTDRMPLAEVMARGLDRSSPIASMLARGGPAALAEFARTEHGFALPGEAVSKCDLCYATRRFLRRFYPDILGPEEVYGASEHPTRRKSR